MEFPIPYCIYQNISRHIAIGFINTVSQRHGSSIGNTRNLAFDHNRFNRDSLLFIRSITDNYSLCRLLADKTDTFFMSYWNTKWIRNRAFLSIDFYLNGKTYSVIKTTQNINSTERIERIDHLFDDWYLLQEIGNHFVGD